MFNSLSSFIQIIFFIQKYWFYIQNLSVYARMLIQEFVFDAKIINSFNNLDFCSIILRILLKSYFHSKNIHLSKNLIFIQRF